MASKEKLVTVMEIKILLQEVYIKALGWSK